MKQFLQLTVLMLLISGYVNAQVDTSKFCLYLPFNENYEDASTAHVGLDLSSNATHDVAYAEGKFGHAGVFDTTALVTSGLDFHSSGDFTIAAWVNMAELPSTLNGTGQRWIHQKDGPNDPGRIHLEVHPANDHFSTFTSGNRMNYTDENGNNVATQQDTWYHLAHVKDTAAGTRTLYINGEAVNSVDIGNNEVNKAEWVIAGPKGEVQGTMIRGGSRLDEFLVTQEALDKATIQDIMNNGVSPVTEIAVSSASGSQSVEVGNTLQMSADVTPDNASDTTFTWSVEEGTGNASIDQDGVLKAEASGEVTVVATANDGSGVEGTLDVTITYSDQIDKNQFFLYLPFNESYEDVSDAGVTVEMSSSATNEVDYTEGKLGQAGVFDTSALVTSGLGFRSDGNFTISAWINMATLPSELGGGQRWIHQKDGADDPGRIHLEVVAVDDQISTFTSGNRMNHTDDEGVNVPIQTDTWYHVAHVKDTALGKRILYVNGDSVNSVDIGTNEVNNEEWVIAGPKNEALSTMIQDGGKMDDLLVTQEVLDRADILEVMNHGVTPVTNISVMSAAANDSVELRDTLQMSVDVTPDDASDTTVTWSVEDGTGSASIDQEGALVGEQSGNVTVLATANDGSGVQGSLEIGIWQKDVTDITVSSAAANDSVEVGSTLQMYAEVQPADASDTTVTWSVIDGTGSASIDQTGLLSATDPGTVEVVAESNDGTQVTDTLEVGIYGIPVSDILVYSKAENDSVELGDSLQMYVDVTPDDASDTTVTWSVNEGTGRATITEEGLLSADSVGTVTVVATANDGSGVEGTLEVEIFRINVTDIALSSMSPGDSLEVNDTLQIYADVTPDDATDTTLSWSVNENTGRAHITSSGELVADSVGLVTVVAAANDGSGVEGTLEVTLWQTDVTDITVTSASPEDSLVVGNTLQMYADVSPEDATDTTVTWSVTDGTGTADIDQNGLLSAVSAGNVTVVATANDGTGVEGTLEVAIGESGGKLLDPALVCAYLPFDGDYKDASGAGVEINPSTNDAATGSVAFEEGKFGQAGAFDKSPLVTDGLNFKSQGSFTISTWINMARYPYELEAGQWWIHQKNDPEGDPGRIHLEVKRDSNNIGSFTSGVRLDHFDEQGEPVSIKTGEWYHVAHVKDTAEGVRKLYVDGELVNTVEMGNEVNDAEFVIGGPKFESGDPMIRGGSKMDELLITQEALGKSAIYKIMNEGLDLSQLITQVTDITVTSDAENDSVKVGNTLQMRVEVAPDDADDTTVTWSVDNGTGTASIDQQGVLTGESAGTVTVVATANDGSDVTGSLEVTIWGEDVANIEVLSENPGDSVSIDESLQMYAEVTPEDAADKTVTWSVENGTGEATIDQQGLLTPQAVGMVTVVATANDGSGVEGTLEVKIYEEVTGIDEPLASKVQVYPNPSNGEFYIKMDRKQRVDYEVYNVMGALVKSGTLEPNSTLIINSFDSGIYYLKIETEDGKAVKKLIVQ